MKNKLKLQLKQLAEKVLNMDENVSTASLQEFAREIYDNLLILSYLENQLKEENFKTERPESKSLDSKSFAEENWFTEPQPLETPSHRDALIEPLMEKIKDIVAEIPPEAQKIEDALEEMLPGVTALEETAVENFKASYGQLPTFERKEDVSTSQDTIINVNEEQKQTFIKELFDESPEEYNRVMSQISTMETLDEVETFVENMVKPDYNFWEGKDQYAQEFMSCIKPLFN